LHQIRYAEITWQRTKGDDDSCAIHPLQVCVHENDGQLKTWIFLLVPAPEPRSLEKKWRGYDFSDVNGEDMIFPMRVSDMFQHLHTY
jgi:hypothetical protein